MNPFVDAAYAHGVTHDCAHAFKRTPKHTNIRADCDVRVLVTSASRLAGLTEALADPAFAALVLALCLGTLVPLLLRAGGSLYV